MAIDLYIAMGEEFLTLGVDFTFEEIYVVTLHDFAAREPSFEKTPHCVQQFPNQSVVCPPSLTDGSCNHRQIGGRCNGIM